MAIRNFSDVLCIWAYIAQLRVDAVKAAFPGQVRFENRFCSVFGDVVAGTWGAEDGYARFNSHLRHAAEAFPEVNVNPNIWLATRPASSMAAHLFKAAQLAEGQGLCAPCFAEDLTFAIRRAFFEHARDIAQQSVLRAIVQDLAGQVSAIEAVTADGRAFAALSSDYQDAEAMRVQGSPSFLLNEGRQKLYANVGFKILEANIQELLRETHPDQASWC